ncbi:AI-2E family transporter [Nocardioides sp. SYSU DS0663]|uniref:AI-2E family transporter n=1 Tax=Nocardioides sp. SYSU DS0663 TaxID=3416445 RepID=UPI003F4C44FB
MTASRRDGAADEAALTLHPDGADDPETTDDADGAGDAGDSDGSGRPGNPAGGTPPEGPRADRSPGGAYLGELGAPLRRSPFVVGFFGGLGLFVAWWLGELVTSIGPTLVLVVVSMFLAAGLNPAVEFFERRAGLPRSWAVLVVIVAALGALALFVVAIVPVISDQVASLTRNAPGWLDSLQENERIQELDEKYGVIDKVRDYVAEGDFATGIFGGVLGVGLAVLSAVANTFIVVVLTLYFLSSLQTTKNALYRLAPHSRRDRVSLLGDRIIQGVGGYVSGAFVVALAAGLSSLVFLFVVGLGEYAVALAFVVALLDVIPMIGATIGAVVVTAIGFATDPSIGIACAVFYLVYQQVENYLIYPRVMSRSVDVPGAVIVIAALVGAALLGVIGALLAIPTAAAILMLTREVVVRRQDAR